MALLATQDVKVGYSEAADSSASVSGRSRPDSVGVNAEARAAVQHSRVAVRVPACQGMWGRMNV